jgi:glycosyltransferase involved in cell wall biosynthesis
MLRNTVYYNLKPFIPRALRAAVRRRLARGMRKRVGEVWPIMPGSETAPDGWPGWPGGHKFGLVLTHDVEGKIGLEKCRSLMRLEMEMGFRSSFNFVPEGNYRAPEELRRELLQNGFEICVHDLRHDGRLFRSAAEFQRRASRINRYLDDWEAVGFRSGFMLHKLDWLHQLRIDYDMSTFDTDPFEPQPEGRNTIFPFWVPCPLLSNGQSASDGSAPNACSAGYMELPYTLPQDSTLFLLLGEKTAGIWQRKVDWIARHGGMVLLDTHPDYMNFDGSKPKSQEYPVKLYADLLEHIRSNHAGEYWHALPREVAAYTAQSGLRREDGRKDSLLPLTVGYSAPSTHIRTPATRKLGLRGKHAAVLLFSYYPADPRPRRAAEALVAEGVTVDLICLQNDGAPSREVIRGINVLRIPIKRCRGTKVKYVSQYSAFLMASFWQLALRSFSRRYDFVHIHNMPDVLVFSALVPKLLGAKIILDLHDPMPELMQTIFGLPEASFGVRLLKYLEKKSIGFADLVLTVNLACKRIYSSRSCLPEKITVVMNAPEDQIFLFKRPTLNNSNGDKPSRPFSILYHGSLVPRNGFDLAVDALALMRERIPNLQLTVCGERSSYFDEVMRSAQERGLAEHVQYLGVKNRREMVEVISRCDIGVVPNHRNTFTEINTPTRIFEYLSLGKPVIAPRTLGIEDYFGDDELIFFEAGDGRDLARQIEFAYFNREELVRIVERGQRIYLANTWSRQKLHLLYSIDRLLDESASSRA